MELSLRGIKGVPQQSFDVKYKGRPVGEYFADIIVEDVLVIELNLCLSVANCLLSVSAAAYTLRDEYSPTAVFSNHPRHESTSR
jgi:PD-(D/E)XK nuclease superfamily